MTTISWKDIIESQEAELTEHGMPEDMYVDPAESTEDDAIQYRIYQKDNYFQVARSQDDKEFKVLFKGGAQLIGGNYTVNAVGSISIAEDKYIITITPRNPQQ